ncbi:MAG: hypothetical protein IRY95_04000 [Clostridia bacterium]|nr:hypothetical protein [Clostridia bacterium]
MPGIGLAVLAALAAIVAFFLAWRVLVGILRLAVLVVVIVLAWALIARYRS